jgi:hypothetical protein
VIVSNCGCINIYHYLLYKVWLKSSKNDVWVQPTINSRTEMSGLSLSSGSPRFSKSYQSDIHRAASRNQTWRAGKSWKNLQETSKKPPFSAGISHHVPSMFDDTEMGRHGDPGDSHPMSRLRIPKRRGPTHRFGVTKVILQPGVVRTAMWPTSTEMKLTWKWSENSTVMGYIYIYNYI